MPSDRRCNYDLSDTRRWLLLICGSVGSEGGVRGRCKCNRNRKAKLSVVFQATSPRGFFIADGPTTLAINPLQAQACGFPCSTDVASQQRLKEPFARPAYTMLVRGCGAAMSHEAGETCGELLVPMADEVQGSHETRQSCLQYFYLAQRNNIPRCGQ
jgi:hypothetical protein